MALVGREWGRVTDLHNHNHFFGSVDDFVPTRRVGNSLRESFSIEPQDVQLDDMGVFELFKVFDLTDYPRADLVIEQPIRPSIE